MSDIVSIFCGDPQMGSLPSVDQVFEDYSARRRGIIRALTTDVEEFFALCDPEKECLCVFGRPNGTWEVNVPPPDIPPELPDPIPGINFSRDEIPRNRWLMMVASHSHSWLISVAFYRGFHFDENESFFVGNFGPFDVWYGKFLNQSILHVYDLSESQPSMEVLFTKINDLPTVCDVLSENLGLDLDGGNESSIKRTSDEQVRRTSNGQVRRTSDERVRRTSDRQVKRTSDEQVRRTSDRQLRRTSDAHLKRPTDEKAKSTSKIPDETTGEDDEVHNDCGSCSGKNDDKFWIMCDVCENWYHCKCVQITPSKAKSIGKYKCPYCRGRR